uniref:Ig-like domain-containing protein n=1 Tax=Gadus morhua TaxID=8049 RepID=A0A8C5BC97_GADMO
LSLSKFCGVLFPFSAAKGQQLTSSESVVKGQREQVTLSCRVPSHLSSLDLTAFAATLQEQFTLTKDSSQEEAYLNEKSLKLRTQLFCVVLKRLLCYRHGTDYRLTTVQAPTVFPLVQCGSGTGEVTIGCMATGFTPASLTFKWEFGGSELANAVQYPTAKKDNRYTGVSQIRVTRQDWDTRKPFTCSAVHAGGTAKAELPDLSILISEIEGSQMVSFGCFAADFSPKDYTITWLRNGKKIDPSESSTSSEGKKNETGTFYNAASYIQATLLMGLETDVFIFPTIEPSTKLEIDILPISLETMYLENNADLVCKVHSSDPVEVKWFNESGEVLSVLESPSSNTYIARTKITYDEWSKGMKWFCEASIKDSIEVPTRKNFVKNNGRNRVPPSVYLLPPVDDLSCTNMTLTCFVKDFYPADILVHWLVDNLTIDGNALYSHKTTNVIENGDLFSTYGQLTFSSDGWKDGRVFRCEVYHMSMDSKNQPIVKLITEKSSGNVNIINMNLGPSTCLPQ